MDEEQILEFLENQLLQYHDSPVQVHQSDCYQPDTEEKYLNRVRELLDQTLNPSFVEEKWETIQQWLQTLRKVICLIHEEPGKWNALQRDKGAEAFTTHLKRLYLRRSDHVPYESLDIVIDLVHEWWYKTVYTRASSPPPPKSWRTKVIPGLYLTGILGLLYLLKQKSG